MAINHDRSTRFFARVLVLAAGVLLALTLAPGEAAAQLTEQVLYSFCQQSNCADGSQPQASLVMDGAGNLYGTTTRGGTGVNCCGVVFKLAPDGTESVLYSFCSLPGCIDGAVPSGLIIDATGNLYGTTRSGGIGPAPGAGVVFKLAPDGTETVLYSFCQQSRCADGSFPLAGLVMDASGNLYGTTEFGGGSGTFCGMPGIGCGTVFQLAPNGAETVLYRFCQQSRCTDGSQPQAGLIMDGAGNLYGTTFYGGGLNNRGTVFQLTPTGTGWTETVIYSFCQQSGCTDGSWPTAGVIMDAAGSLYGTTSGKEFSTDNQGIAFQLTPTGTGWTETVLYSFCQLFFCNDGAQPLAGLIMDAAGNLYGTTAYGGTAARAGVVFELGPDGTQTVLYSFCSQPNCADGANPFAGLIMDAAGNLYGTTSAGGVSAGCLGYPCGVVFALSPPPGATRAGTRRR